MNQSARRINALTGALELRTYLEIGAHDGKTFRDVTAEDRTAVDPRFGFDTSQFENENTRFYAQESDKFFASTHNGSPFDIIFIDGLHHFGQVIRDLLNAIMHSHSKTVLLIDDTKPVDVYSAIPNVHEAIKFRRMGGSDDGAWHGDVYKIVFFIHDFLPAMNYRTLLGQGNPQTLVWRSNEFVRKPRFNDMEKISRLTYYDLINNIDILRESPEDDGINLCVGELRHVVLK